ncbi:hypothetical protein ACFY7C_24680 [Streptomyces sp. NPDC012769]|uniref:hypothetical protein n=1 Tax=Streptomyces sp. NPDC012769 TaxID=3364848 RepID=UPI0036768CE8
MDVFVCARCDAVLTVPLARVPLPPEAHLSYGHEPYPALMEPGTYAIDPAPSGPPFRDGQDIGEAAAAAQGVFAPWPVSFGARGRIVTAPGDVRGTVLVPEKCVNHCLGIAAGAEPNLECAGCGLPVASREDDCGLWQTVWLEPGAVRRVPTGVPAPPRTFRAVPPVDPPGFWSPRWEAAMGAALARLVVASGGARVGLPAGVLTDVLGRALDALLPPGPVVRTAGPAGPGVPGDGLDIALVPHDPRTGGPWRPEGGAVPVPLPDGVWAWLALPPETSPLPASGTLPAGVLRDDYPLPDHPWRTLQPDRRAFRGTLARMPEVREPWLRALYDRRF